MDIGSIWNLIILDPLINVMVWLSHILFGSFGITVIVLTIIIRLAMWPLTMKQLHATKALQSLQPKLAAIQQKYARDKQRLAQEQMALYKEARVSPVGCLGPMLIQMPIWIALYQAIIRVLAVTPEDLLNLSSHLYNWPVVFQSLPLSNGFLWMDLSRPDFLLAILVGVTMWIQQKMSTPPAQTPQQAQQAQITTFLMPVMFTFFSISFPSGLAMYWVASAVIGIVMQYFVTGFGDLKPTYERLVARFGGRQTAATTLKTGKASAAPVIVEQKVKTRRSEEIKSERSGSQRQDTGRSDTKSPEKTKRKPGRGGTDRP